MVKEQVEVLDKVHRVGTHCDSLGGNEELSMQLSGEKFPERENRKCKGPEARAPWEYLRNIRKPVC